MYPGSLMPGNANNTSRLWAQIQWQPLIDLATDTHDHDELEASNLFPIILLNPPSGAAAFEINAEPGTYVITGAAAELLVGRLLVGDPGVYAITGQSAELLIGRALSGDPGSYLMSGADAAVLADRSVSADPGVYSIIGNLAETLKGYVLSLTGGSYVITGSDTEQQAEGGGGRGAGPWKIARTRSDLMRRRRT